ncbi:sensor histidine kinase KdpD [Microbacterium sp. EST19A]|uniref:sensor histidine kinase n=1 Tax=Microbacterium sp. EST19A TaxID=2862681 RepID=UPI001CBED5C2|nr:HAMP domain-containing sensor histidine kinase [Microbacterium sp. EST19A]
MSDRRSVALGVLAAAPVGLCALAAGGMVIAGDHRVLAMELALPGAVLIAGALVSAIPGALLLWRAAGARSRRREAAAVEAAGKAAALQERTRHQRFLARLDHELKNPLTAIRATAVAAPDSGQSPAWRTVDAQATKLSTLVRDLRKLADLETRPLELELVDVEHLIAEAITALRQQDPAAGARLEFSVTRVPWAVPPLTADVDLLSLAIDNVLGNAAKYSSAGPIEVRLREQDGWAVIDVADAGRGIPANEVSQVFDELARAQNARDVAGSGIGLTLVATVMRQHGGDVSIRSVEGSGTLVTLRLPIRR